MMSREPQPSRTAEKSRFSIMAVVAIHHFLLYAWAKLGGMTAGDTQEQETYKKKTLVQQKAGSEVLLGITKYDRSLLCITVFYYLRVKH